MCVLNMNVYHMVKRYKLVVTMMTFAQKEQCVTTKRHVLYNVQETTSVLQCTIAQMAGAHLERILCVCTKRIALQVSAVLHQGSVARSVSSIQTVRQASGKIFFLWIFIMWFVLHMFKANFFSQSDIFLFLNIIWGSSDVHCSLGAEGECAFYVLLRKLETTGSTSESSGMGNLVDFITLDCVWVKDTKKHALVYAQKWRLWFYEWSI